MDKFNIKCPKCHKPFTIKAANVGALVSKNFTCPSCGTATPFAQLLGVGGPTAPTQDLHTHIGNATLHGITGNMETRALRMPKFMVMTTGSVLHLPMGSFVIGRDSADSTADVRIAPDPYMSRSHARVIVARMGTQTVCKIQSLNTVNRIFINDRPLKSGETATLNNGDVLLLGMTKVKYTY